MHTPEDDQRELIDRVSHPIGALRPMPDASTPVESPAARDIIAKAKAIPMGQKLATLTGVIHDGSRIRVWTKVDVKDMQADYWDATKFE